MGLPYRFGVAAETKLERFNGGGGFQTISIEGRYALADWNKIPLNPTLFRRIQVWRWDHSPRRRSPTSSLAKRKRKVAHPKYRMPTNFGSCWLRISGSVSNGR
jgi:hypothetical protein